MQAAKQHFRTCNLCEAMCGLSIKVEDEKIISIKGDSEDPFSKGFICPKAVALQDVYNDPDRLKHPVKKVDNQWKEISWSEAFDEIGQNIRKIQKLHGLNSIGIYQGNPSAHNYGTLLFSPDLARALRTRNKFSATSIDQLPHHLAAQFMFGHFLMIPIPDIDRTDFFLVIGANPMASNGSLMTAAGMPNRIKALQQRGGKMIVVDPRMTETALKADQHLFINPGSDVLLLLAMIHTLFSLDLVDQTKHRHSKGTEAIKEVVKKFAPETVSKHTGISADAIISLTKRFAAANSAVCYGRLGVSVQRFGSLCQWLINVINFITGNFDSAGGAMFPLPAVDIVKASGLKGTYHKFGRWKSRVQGFPEFAGELPVSTLSDEILTLGEGQIKALITNAGNPVLSTPNGQRLDQALSTLDYMVAIDIYINETTRHADIILPPATGLEIDHFDLAFNLFAVRNTVKYSKPLFRPGPGSRYDWQIFKELTLRIGRKKGLLSKLLYRLKTPRRLLDLGLKLGPYGYFSSYNIFRWLSLKKLEAHPHGMDLGPMTSQIPKRLFTKDKKIDLAPKPFVEAASHLLDHFDQSVKDDFDLTIIGRRHLRSNNSWMHNSFRLVKGPVRCTLLMHPSDAAKRSLKNGQEARVESTTGVVHIPVEISADIMPGVVSLPHGWGHQREGVRLRIAKETAGASLNDLTDHTLTDTISGNAAFSNNKVRVNAVLS